MLAITGATGQLGQATLRALSAKTTPDQLVALVRDPQKATALYQQGVHVRQGNYNNVASLVAAFQGVATVLLISGTDMAARTQQHRNVIDAAREAGVQHLVYTSVLNPSTASAFIASPSHVATEAHLRASGLTYTLLRNTLYLDLVPMLVGKEALPSGQFYFAAGTGQASFALRAEIAEALAHVLTTSGHENQTYDIAPAPTYSMQDVAAVISEVSGQPVAYVPVSSEDMAAGMRRKQVPEHLTELVVSMAQAMAQQEFNASSPVFEQLLGRKPTDLKTYLATIYAH